MEQHATNADSRSTVRKTYKEQLRPTPAQEQALGEVLWRCRTVLARLDTTYHAFFRRVQAGEKPGYPRFKGRHRYRSFTFKEYGNGARLDNGALVLSKIGRISVHWSRPIEGTPKTITVSREADGWYVAISCAEVPVKPLPLTGQETGIDLGIESFATRADGQQIKNPRWYRTAEGHLAMCQRRVSRRKKGSTRRAKAVAMLAKAHQHIAHQRRDFQHKEARKLVQQYDVIYHEDLTKTCGSATWCGIIASPRASRMPGGANSSPSSLTRLQAPVRG